MRHLSRAPASGGGEAPGLADAQASARSRQRRRVEIFGLAENARTTLKPPARAATARVRRRGTAADRTDPPSVAAPAARGNGGGGEAAEERARRRRPRARALGARARRAALGAGDYSARTASVMAARPRRSRGRTRGRRRRERRCKPRPLSAGDAAAPARVPAERRATSRPWKPSSPSIPRELASVRTDATTARGRGAATMARRAKRERCAGYTRAPVVVRGGRGRELGLLPH